MPRCFKPIPALATLAFIALSGLLPTEMFCSSGTDKGWDVVTHLNRNASFTFVDRNHTCTSGKINRANDRKVTVSRQHDPDIDIARTDLLRITSGEWAPGVVFSGRSSWSDVVRIVGRRFHPDIAVVTKSGEEHKGKLLTASETGLTIGHAGKKTDINKSEVSIVSYTRTKPLSDFTEYLDDELAWMKIFDPQLWPRMLHLHSISIRLYDSSLSQDDSTIICIPGQRDVTRNPL
jgi:hypothetical protein